MVAIVKCVWPDVSRVGNMLICGIIYVGHSSFRLPPSREAVRYPNQM
jgi:hypothetical protein